MAVVSCHILCSSHMCMYCYYHAELSLPSLLFKAYGNTVDASTHTNLKGSTTNAQSAIYFMKKQKCNVSFCPFLFSRTTLQRLWNQHGITVYTSTYNKPNNKWLYYLDCCFNCVW